MSTLLPLLAWCATGALVLSGALQLGPGVLSKFREHPGLVLRFLLVVWVVAPAMAILVTRIFGLRGIGGTTVLLMAICPGVPLILSSARSVGGATSTALIVLLATALTAPIFLPMWTKILSAVHPIALTIPAGRVVRALVPAVLAPLLVGFAIRALSERIALAIAAAAGWAFRVGLAIVIVIQLVRGAPTLLDVPLRTILAVAIVTFTEAMLGYWAGGPSQEDKGATGMAAALGNPALALAVVAASYPGYHEAGALVAAYVVLRALLLLPFKQWLKHPRRPSAPAPA